MNRAFLILLAFLIDASLLAQSVGIGTDMPSPSAKLDVNSTTQGVLLPRMNFSQRIAIPNPAQGLLVFQTDSLSALYIYSGIGWLNVNTGKLALTTDGTNSVATLVNDTLNIPPQQSVKHTIGEVFGGGIVYFITPDSLHGLIVETQDQASNISWYDAQDAVSTPANHSISGKNFTDWRLPTKNELNLLCAARNAGVITNFVNGSQHWSSSEYNYQQAWNQYLTSLNSFQNYMNKASITNFYVRAVRSF